MSMIRVYWKSLTAFLLTVWAVQFASMLVTFPAVREWYPQLAKPGWNPPDWVFGPVWSVLYILIAIAGWRLWVAAVKNGVPQPWRHPALRVYGLQLAANVAWSCLFFGLHQPALALVDIFALLAAIGLCMYHARTLDHVASWLFVPYLLWVGYATTLNAAIVWLN